MDYSFTSSLNPNLFDEFSLQHPLTSFFQSTAWPKVKTEWEPIYTGVYQGTTLVAASLVLKRNLPLNLAIFYLPRGPLLDYDNVELVKFYFSSLKQLAKKEKVFLIRTDPNLIIDIKPLSSKINLQDHQDLPWLKNLKMAGLKHYGFNLGMYETYQPRFSALIKYQDYDLKVSKGYRDSIKAQKRDVELVNLTYQDLPTFIKLLKETEKRQNISLRDINYFEKLYQAYSDNIFLVATKLDLQQALIRQENNLRRLEKQISQSNSETLKENLSYQAKIIGENVSNFQKKIAAGEKEAFLSTLLAIKHGPTCELLYAGADTSYGRYYASYLSYQSGIAWGQKKGCLTCNLGGIPGTLDDGLTTYKSFFDANMIEYIGEFDLPVKKITANLFRFAYPFLRKIRKYILRD